MSSNPIKIVPELIDPTGSGEINELSKSLSALKRATDKFEKSVSGIKTYGDALEQITKVAKDYKAIIGALSPGNDTSRVSMEKYEPLLRNLSKLWKENSDSLKGQMKTVELAKGSVAALEKENKELIKAYKALNPEIKAHQVFMEQYSKTVQENRAKIDHQTQSLKKVTKQLEFAEGSYYALLQRNKELDKQLKNLPDAFDKVTGAINLQNAEAKKLYDEHARNTHVLKGFEKQLGQNFRNVGNYAASIIEAAEQLRRNRSSLLQQIDALKAQAAANSKNTTIQNQIQEELKKTNQELDKVNRQLKSYGDNALTSEKITSSLKKGFRELGVEVLGVYAGIHAVSEGSRFIIRTNAEISDSLADVRKTTGLTEEQVQELSDSFESFDTRTALKELLEIAKIGGQMGVSKNDIEAFTNAIDKANVALGDEFAGGAEEVATSLAKLDNVFKLSDIVGLEKSLTNIGSAINELGASGAATSPFISDFALRVGAVSKNAGLGLGNVLGYGAALEELGFSAEVSGTAFNKLISKMAANSKSFFEIAKMGDVNLTLKEFQHLVNTDVQKALNVFLNGLNAGGESTTEFNELLKELDMTGSGINSVLTTLAKNTDLVASRQKTANEQLSYGTSLLDEYNIKNDNLAASIDKLKNGLTNLVTSGEVQAFLKGTIDGLLAFGSAIKTVVSGISENKDVIAAAVPLLIGYRTATFQATVAQSGWTASLGITRMAMLRNMVVMRQWWATMMANPLGLVLTAVAALVIGFNRLEKNSERNLAIQKKSVSLNKELEQAIADVTKAQSEINEKITEYTKLSPDQQKALRDEIQNNKKLALAVLERMEVERQALVQKAAEINVYDKIKAGILSGGNAIAVFQNIVEGQTDRMTKAHSRNADQIQRLKDAILEYDAQLAGINKKAADESERKADEDAELAKKRLKAEAELTKFRLEQQALALDYFVEQQQKANDKNYELFEEQKITIDQYRDRVASTGEQITNAQRQASRLRIQIARVERDLLLQNEELLADERTLILEQYAAKVAEIEQSLSEKLVIDKIEPIRINVDTSEFDKNLQKSQDDSIKRMQDWSENYETEQRRLTDIAREEEEKRAELKRAAFDLAMNLGNAQFEFKRNELEAESAEAQARYDNDMKLAGDNAEAKQRIQEQYEKKMAAIRRKQAVMERNQALFNIAISTAEAVAKSFAASPLTFGLPFSAFALANGALQTALVLSRPLPQFFKGTKNAPEGLAIVDEKGPEIIERKGKRYMGKDEGPRLVYLRKGDIIHTAEETASILADSESILAANSAANSFNMAGRDLEKAAYNKLVYESRVLVKQDPGMQRLLEKIDHSINNRPEYHYNITKFGPEYIRKKGNSITKYLNGFFPNS